jgi:hypothetical protein
MFEFSKTFIQDVKNHFGSEMSRTLEERLEEGNFDGVVRFLRNSIPTPSWNLFNRMPFHDLRVMADKTLRLQALISRAQSELAHHRNQEIIGATAR